jgi:2-oxoglutarate dehydrogenase E1 component
MESVIWCQEEPINQGAWYSSQHHLKRVIHALKPEIVLSYVGRDRLAAPASGYMSVHLEEQKAFIDEALTLDN